MLSMDGQKSPQYYSLIGHELAHNWFMGMVASNETPQGRQLNRRVEITIVPITS